MKKGIFLLLAFLCITTLATAQKDKTKSKEKDEDQSGWDSGWGGKRVKGMGAVVKESRNISGFTGVESAISADIVLKQGSSFKVTVEGQKNILDLLKTELKGNSLKISFEKGYSINYKDNLKIYVEAPYFESLGMSGSGNVRVDGVLSGTKLDINISGSGNFDLDNIKYADLDLGISGSGDVKLSGSTERVVMHISGSGEVKAGDLKSQSVRCQVSGSGNITCNAQKSLDAIVSGSGDIRYSGKPASIKTKVTGSGDIDAF